MLYILTPIFCVALCVGAVFSFSDNNKVNANAEATTRPASILNLNGEFKNALQGGQKEYIYFGTNTSAFGGNKTGAIKWRVLSNGSSANDNKYSSGNMLLWADYQLGANSYNSTGTAYQNPNYAYWSTSRVRAALNGGYYASFVGNGTTMPATNSNSAKIETTASYYGKIFTEKAEQNAVVAADTYKTDNFGWNTDQSQFYLRDNITATAYGSNGKYNESILGSGTAKDAKKTTAGNLTAAGNGSTTATGGGVQETTSGDKLFLLDYYDINSADFGFVDSGLTYANKVSASWTTSSNSYPSYPKSSITWTTLQFTDSVKFYWLRQPGRVDTTYSSAMTVTSTGMLSSNVVTGTYGVRPAFNLNTNNVVYATAANVSGIGSTLSSVSTAKTTADGKPEYKVYVKDLDYKTDKAISILDNSTLKIAYKTPSNFASGNMVLLLSNSDGSVAYQATQSATGGTTDTKIANFTLPSGVTFGDYTATLLFTSNNGGVNSETVYAAYSLDGKVDAPQDVTGITYDGQGKWTKVTDESWYDAQIHGNTSFVKVKSIEYTDNIGSTPTTDNTGNTANIINAGKYKVTLELATGLTWSTGDGTFTITVAQAKPNVTADFKNKPLPNPLYTSYNGGKLPELVNAHASATAGKIEWQSGETPTEGKTEYYWMFTPGDDSDPTVKNNYSVVSGKTNETKMTVPYRQQGVDHLEIKINQVDGADVTLYDAYTLDDDLTLGVKSKITVYQVMQDGVTKKPLDSSKYTLRVKDHDGLVATESGQTITLVAEDEDSNSGELDIEVAKAEVVAGSLDPSYSDGGNPLVYSESLTLDDVKGNLTLRAKWNYAPNRTAVIPADKYKVTGTLKASASTSAADKVEFTVECGDESKTFKVTIKKGTLSPTVTFANDTVTYDESAHKIEATVSGLPTGLTLTPTYTVTGSSTTYDAAGYTDAGTYNYSVTFTHTDPNYEQYTTASTATLTIEQKEVDMSGVEFKNAQKYANGDSYTLEITGTLPTTPAVSVSYTVEGQPAGTLSFSAEGTYKFTAKFTHTDPNYKPIADMKATLEITNKKLHDMTGVTASGGEKLTGDITNGFSGTYDGGEFEIAIDAGTLPTSVAVDTVVYEKKQADGSWIAVVGKPSGAGEYRVKVSFTNSDPAYATPQDIEILLTVDKADIDTDGTEFAPAGGEESGLKPAADGKGFTGTYKEDGNYEVDIDPATLPAGTQKKGAPVYKKLKEDGNPANPDDWTVVSKPDGSGTYKVVFELEPTDPDNYNEIDPIEVPLVLSDRVVEKVTAKVDGEAKFDINSTLDDLKKVISAEVEYNNGTKEAVEVDSLTLACDTLRDGGKFEVGAQTITITYNDGTKDFTTTVTVTVAKAKVALPVYKGTLSYTGLELKPTANDFDGYNADIMTFNETKTVAGLNAGAYKAVFELKDSDRYEWATTTTASKKLFAAAVYDGEISIDPTFEAAVDWNIAKAKISATKAEGKLPVFASESYTGSLGEVIALKYYTDETCTEEVAADALGYNTNYFVKAMLSDEAKANFELDETSLVFAAKPFEYLTPEKELTVWEKIVVFLKANWLWIVIAVVALILLITIIALAAKHAKKKRLLAEKKEAEEKAERERKEERDREERRLEREERMARMSQQQAMPQMMMPQMMPQMQMPQPQPQYAPQPQSQTVQPVMGGGSVDSAQITRIETELATLKAAQEAKDLAELKAEQAAMRSDLNALRGSEKTGGISIDAMTEIMTAALKNVLATATQQAIAGQPAQPAQLTDGTTAPAAPAAAQVPPDAVMTTVTTTKIDTTKKAQGTQGNAQTTRTTRSFVPPMPVDDGRVFDVGGFYKPADPVDLVDDDVDNK